MENEFYRFGVCFNTTVYIQIHASYLHSHLMPVRNILLAHFIAHLLAHLISDCTDFLKTLLHIPFACRPNVCFTASCLHMLDLITKWILHLCIPYVSLNPPQKLSKLNLKDIVIQSIRCNDDDDNADRWISATMDFIFEGSFDAASDLVQATIHTIQCILYSAYYTVHQCGIQLEFSKIVIFILLLTAGLWW